MRSLLAIMASLVFLSASPGTVHGLESYGKLDTQAVEVLMNSGYPVVVADARLPRYDDGRRLPGAVLIPHNADESVIRRLIPSKDTIIITYCSNRRCPMAGKLAENLIKLGYHNVLHYPVGLKGWEQAGKALDSKK